LLAASSGAARIESADLFDLDRRQRTSYVGYDATTGQSAFYGVAWNRDGSRAWVSGGGQGVLHALSVSNGVLTETGTIAAGPFAAGLAYGRTPRGDRLYVANNLSGPAGGAAGNPAGGTVTAIDPATGATEKTIDLGHRLQPLGVAFNRTGDKALVTNWMGRSVSVIDTDTQAERRDRGGGGGGARGGHRFHTGAVAP
jgi:DNA-binding beta-propeller fold protein YncE